MLDMPGHRRQWVWACEWVSIIVALRDPPGDQQQTHVQKLLKLTHPHSLEPVGALPGDDPSLQGMLYNTPGSLDGPSSA